MSREKPPGPRLPPHRPKPILQPAAQPSQRLHLGHGPPDDEDDEQ